MSTPMPQGASPAGPFRALLWDVDGTLAETELQGHRRAFNGALADEGFPWRWDVQTYLGLLRVSGGRERLRAFLRQHQQDVSEQQIERLQRRKQSRYDALMRSGAVGLRPGVARLIGAARAAGLHQAIVTTSGRASVRALLDGAGAGLHDAFSFWICGEDVQRKKPDPQGYQQAIERLQLDPGAILAIEDSRNGLQAATAAGLACLVTLSDSSRWEAGPRGDEGFEAALAVLDGLGDARCPLRSHRGPPCPGGQVTVSWLQRLSAGS